MKEFYNTKDVMRITGYKKTKSNDIINILKEQFQEEHPDITLIGCTIPIWYFNEKILGKKENIKKEPKEVLSVDIIPSTE